MLSSESQELMIWNDTVRYGVTFDGGIEISLACKMDGCK